MFLNPSPECSRSSCQILVIACSLEISNNTKATASNTRRKNNTNRNKSPWLYEKGIASCFYAANGMISRQKTRLSAIGIVSEVEGFLPRTFQL